MPSTSLMATCGYRSVQCLRVCAFKAGYTRVESRIDGARELSMKGAPLSVPFFMITRMHGTYRPRGPFVFVPRPSWVVELMFRP